MSQSSCADKYKAKLIYHTCVQEFSLFISKFRSKRCLLPRNFPIELSKLFPSMSRQIRSHIYRIVSFTARRRRRRHHQFMATHTRTVIIGQRMVGMIRYGLN